MGVDVTTETVIARPRHEVAAFAIDPDRLPLWYVNIRAVEWKTEPPLRVGTRLALAAQFLRRRLEYVYEVVEHVPGERFVMRAVDGPFAMETIYAWRDAGDHATAMTMRNHGSPAGILALAGSAGRVGDAAGQRPRPGAAQGDPRGPHPARGTSGRPAGRDHSAAPGPAPTCVS